MANESETRRGAGKRSSDTQAGNATGNTDPSATSAGANSEHATMTDPVTEKKKPAGPRQPQKRVLHIFYKGVMEDGSPVPPGLKLEVVNVMSDARKVIEYMDGTDIQAQGIKRFKYEVVSEPRGSKTEDGASDAA